MKTTRNLVVLILVIIDLFITGCSNENPTMNSQSTNPISITPADNSTNIRLDTSIEIQFAKPVDKQVVEKNFRLISSQDVNESNCPYGQNMMHGNMMMVMMDSLKMKHMDDFHSVHGSFNWNSDSTRCIFTPDSTLLSNMQYMMHFGKEMMDMLQQRMGDMMNGGMMGNGNMTGMGSGQMSGHMMQHFTTLGGSSFNDIHDARY